MSEIHVGDHLVCWDCGGRATIFVIPYDFDNNCGYCRSCFAVRKARGEIEHEAYTIGKCVFAPPPIVAEDDSGATTANN
jgi:hypothetical protein